MKNLSILSLLISISVNAQPCLLSFYGPILPGQQCLAEVSSSEECQALAQKFKEKRAQYYVEWIPYPQPYMINDQNSCEFVLEHPLLEDFVFALKIIKYQFMH